MGASRRSASVLADCASTMRSNNLEEECSRQYRVQQHGILLTISPCEDAEVLNSNTIERLDVEILSKLTQNARASIAELAIELGVSRNTVQLRIRRLEEAGILMGFRPIINLSAIGMPVQA